jgi:hypothetical protein
MTKPFLSPNEATLKQSGAYLSAPPKMGDDHAIHSWTALGSFAPQMLGRIAVGVMFMTFVVAFLVCCSAAVFLAHAFDAYQAK